MNKASEMTENGYIYFHIINKAGKYAFSVAFARNRFINSAECAVFDFETKEKFSCREKTNRLKKKDEFFVSEKENAFCKTSNGTCSLENSNGKVRFFADFKKCFSHTDMKAELVFDKKEISFLLGNRDVAFVRVGGCVEVAGRVCNFDSSTDLAFFEKNTSPEKNRHKGASCFCGGVFGKYKVALSLTDDVCNGLENKFICNGKNIPLGEIKISKPIGKGYDEWTVSSSVDALKVSFKPAFNDRLDSRSCHADRFFGFLNGEFSDCDGVKTNFENIPAFLKYVN